MSLLPAKKRCCCVGDDCVVGGAPSSGWTGTDGSRASLWWLKSDGTVSKYWGGPWATIYSCRTEGKTVYAAGSRVADWDGCEGNYANVFKFDANGAIVWYWDSGDGTIFDIEIAGDYLYVTGSASNLWTGGSDENYSVLWKLNKETGEYVDHFPNPVSVVGQYTSDAVGYSVCSNGTKVWVTGNIYKNPSSDTYGASSLLELDMGMDTIDWVFAYDAYHSFYTMHSPGHGKCIRTDGTYVYLVTGATYRWRRVYPVLDTADSSYRNIFKFRGNGTYQLVDSNNYQTSGWDLWHINWLSISRTGITRIDLAGDRWLDTCIYTSLTLGDEPDGYNTKTYMNGCDSDTAYQWYAGSQTNLWLPSEGAYVSVWKFAYPFIPVWYWWSGANTYSISKFE